jgi:hypothetical protein
MTDHKPLTVEELTPLWEGLDNNLVGFRSVPLPFLARVQATIDALRSQVEALTAERDAKAKAFDTMDGLDGAACDAIRKVLRRAGVPEAAFIDDFVRNAIAQRDAALAGVERLEGAS